VAFDLKSNISQFKYKLLFFDCTDKSYSHSIDVQKFFSGTVANHKSFMLGTLANYWNTWC